MRVICCRTASVQIAVENCVCVRFEVNTLPTQIIEAEPERSFDYSSNITAPAGEL